MTEIASERQIGIGFSQVCESVTLIESESGSESGNAMCFVSGSDGVRGGVHDVHGVHGGFHGGRGGFHDEGGGRGGRGGFRGDFCASNCGPNDQGSVPHDERDDVIGGTRGDGTHDDGENHGGWDGGTHGGTHGGFGRARDGLHDGLRGGIPPSLSLRDHHGAYDRKYRQGGNQIYHASRGVNHDAPRDGLHGPCGCRDGSRDDLRRSEPRGEAQPLRRK